MSGLACYDCPDGTVIDRFFSFAPAFEVVQCNPMGKDLYCIDRITGRFAGCPKINPENMKARYEQAQP